MLEHYTDTAAHDCAARALVTITTIATRAAILALAFHIPASLAGAYQ